MQLIRRNGLVRLIPLPSASSSLKWPPPRCRLLPLAQLLPLRAGRPMMSALPNQMHPIKCVSSIYLISLTTILLRQHQMSPLRQPLPSNPPHPRSKTRQRCRAQWRCCKQPCQHMHHCLLHLWHGIISFWHGVTVVQQTPPQAAWQSTAAARDPRCRQTVAVAHRCLAN